ncbi:MAG: histidinol dehydrogenase [Saprospiraceae bacterium]
MKKITFQEISRAGLESLAPAIMAMARAEDLEAHAMAVAVRLGEVEKS